LTRSRLEQPHSLVTLLVPWKRLIFGPSFLLQISGNVPPRRSGSLVAPKSERLLNVCKVMVYLPYPAYPPNLLFIDYQSVNAIVRS